jgi:hypothetical protein
MGDKKRAEDFARYKQYDYQAVSREWLLNTTALAAIR